MRHQTKSKVPVTAAALSIKDAAQYLSISEASVWRLISRGILPRVRLGGRTLISVPDLQTLISRNRDTANFEESKLALL